MESKYPWTPISYFFFVLAEEAQRRNSFGSYIHNLLKNWGVNSKSFVVREFSIASPEILVFWILSWSKYHGQQFSQIKRSAFSNIMANDWLHAFLKFTTLGWLRLFYIFASFKNVFPISSHLFRLNSFMSTVSPLKRAL